MSGNRYRPLIGLLASCLGLIALLALPSGAAARDRNHDRIPDRWEKAHHLSLKVNQARRDQDRDGLRNRGEFQATDLPHDEDTDGDGTPDGSENAGTIESFQGDVQGGVLTIKLFSGGTLAGTVTPDTEVDCTGVNEPNGDNNDGDHESQAGGDRLARLDESSGPGSENSGPSSDNEGNDEADENDEQGETDCSTADLTPTTVVHEAETTGSGTSTVFTEIELAK
ncbi:MAG: hypothetical protein M3R23_03525 [Actinomycetota bacterium]|nr:hypothetical protein [Actinomycetota bacterium]